MRTRLTIRRVRSWKPEHDQGINSLLLLLVASGWGCLGIETNQALVLTIEVEGVDVEVEDLGFKGKARIKRGPMGIETSWSTVHE